MSKRDATRDLALVLVTAIAHLVIDIALHQKALFIALAGVTWIAWIVHRIRTPGIARAWGLRRDNLRKALLVNAVIIVVLGASMIAFGLLRGRGAPSAGFWFLLALYPIYGVLQQLLLCGVLYGGLLTLTDSERRAHAIAAVLFGLLHAPVPALGVLTLIAGTMWLFVFRKLPNVIALGLSHGWLAAIAYYFLLGRDPWEELLRSLPH